jgi:hypothetical protein
MNYISHTSKRGLKLRFLEWFELESFMDMVDYKASCEKAFRESVLTTLKVARIALSPRIINESGLDKCPPEFDEISRNDALKKIHDALRVMRKRAVVNRKRMVDAIKAIHDWMSRFAVDDGIEDLDFSNFSDVLKPEEIKNKDTFEVAITILGKLEYCTKGECKKILDGLNLPEDDKKNNEAQESLKKQVAYAAAESGNDSESIKSGDDFVKAKEDLRCAITSLYSNNIRRETRKNKEHFEEGDLFNEFLTSLLDMATRRKWDGDEPLPWGSGTDFEDLMGSKLDSSHMDNYLARTINDKAKTLRQRRAASNNPASRDRSKQMGIHNDRPRKAGLINKDLELYAKWMAKKDAPQSDDWDEDEDEDEDEDAVATDSDPMIPKKNPLDFYIKHLSGSKEPNIVEPQGRKDRLRLAIMKAIEYEIQTNTNAAALGLSLDPANIVGTLRSYTMHFLGRPERQSLLASELMPKGKEGREDFVVTALSRSQETDDEFSPDTQNPMDSTHQDEDIEGDSGSEKSNMLVKFFRPYLLRAIKEIAVRGEKSAAKALYLCLKFRVPCSFTANNKGEPNTLVVKEPEVIDNDLDERVRSYMFDRLSGDGGDQGLSFGDSEEKGKKDKDKTWSQWSHEQKKDTRAMDARSFCRLFFDSLFKNPGDKGKADKLERMSQMLEAIPETSRRVPNDSGGSVEVKHYEYDPNMFPASWSPSGRSNSLKQVKKTMIGVALHGDRNLRGSLSELCDKVFHEMIKSRDADMVQRFIQSRSIPPQDHEMIKRSGVSLKDMITSKRAAEEKRKLDHAREMRAADEKHAAATTKVVQPIRTTPVISSTPPNQEEDQN